MGIGIKTDKGGDFIYDSSIPFRSIALQFQSQILENCRRSLEKQYRIIGMTKENLPGILDSKLVNGEGQAFKSYLIEAETLKKELTLNAN